MAHSTPTSNIPSLVQHRRKSQVFVEIPPSPLFKARVTSTSSKVDHISTSYKPLSHKENPAPLSTKTSMNNIPTDKKSKGKRKVQDDEDGAAQPDVKKTKISKPNNDGTLVACHQCRSKKQPDVVLQCTRISKTTGNRCKASYCDTCLRNRYGEELKAISQGNHSESSEDHCNADYYFDCPRCAGNCNCAPCRKRQGLAPVGKFISALGGESVREILEKNPQASGLLPKNTVIPVPKAPKLPQADLSSKTTEGSGKVTKAPTTAPRVKRNTTGDTGKRTKQKEAPEPVWASIPHARTREEIEDRIYLREFILRFNPILNIGIRNLEELDDFTSLHDPSTKAILIALLELIAIEDDTQKKAIQSKVKTLRSLGLNWTKIVPILYDLRNSMPKGHALRSLPDLGHSDVEATYNTRGTRMQGLYADQLLPVLLHLMQVVGDGASVRQELEEGNKQAKEARAAYFKAMREETERWGAERAELTEAKPEGEKEKIKVDIDAWKVKFKKAESEHKAIVTNIQNAHKPEMDSCASRFASLGRDTDGRTYYSLSASGPQRGKKERLPSEGERSAMKRWGWFIAVFGKPGTVVQHEGDDTDEDEDEEDLNAERWWGFADVEEMRKLSQWLAYCAETDTFDSKGGAMKPSGSSAAATATSSTLTSRLPTPSGTTAISHPGSRPFSPISDLSDSQSEDDDNNDMDVDSDDPHPHAADMSQPATSTGMKALSKSILEFADFVNWRLKRDQNGSKRKGDDTAARFYEETE